MNGGGVWRWRGNLLAPLVVLAAVAIATGNSVIVLELLAMLAIHVLTAFYGLSGIFPITTTKTTFSSHYTVQYI